ncbi:MAG: orotate phosphoribosyltransferase, partial [Candidatus Dadabacteria bacterium]
MKDDFINFLIKTSALQFGEFVTKSGRHTPYFINTGKLNTGETLFSLAKFYAAKIKELALNFDILFGPAYKGIPLVSAVSIMLWLEQGINIKWCSDRKEVKDHGDIGKFLGAVPKENERVLIVEDVITAGTTFYQLVPMLQERLKVKILGAIVAVDREERGKKSNLSAKDKLKKELNLSIYPI